MNQYKIFVCIFSIPTVYFEYFVYLSIVWIWLQTLFILS